MDYFPQLASGAVGQFPLRRTRVTRTINNALPGGQSIRLADPWGQGTEWQLAYSELTDGEREVLEGFFSRMEGRLNAFTFLDPAGNLLKWSEDLAREEWQRDPLLSLSQGIADPLRTTRAWRISNGGGAAQAIAQTLNIPGWYYYCLSLYARSVEAAQVTLMRGDQRSPQRVDQRWRRVMLAGEGTGAEETVRFGLELESNTAVEIFGLQVEAQPGASVYQKTLAQGGVYGGTRFGEDELRIETTAPGRHSCTLSVIHGEHL